MINEYGLFGASEGAKSLYLTFSSVRRSVESKLSEVKEKQRLGDALSQALERINSMISTVSPVLDAFQIGENEARDSVLEKLQNFSVLIVHNLKSNLSENSSSPS